VEVDEIDMLFALEASGFLASAAADNREAVTLALQAFLENAFRHEFPESA
jgi:hypothetical protein